MPAPHFWTIMHVTAARGWGRVGAVPRERWKRGGGKKNRRKSSGGDTHDSSSNSSGQRTGPARGATTTKQRHPLRPDSQRAGHQPDRRTGGTRGCTAPRGRAARQRGRAGGCRRHRCSQRVPHYGNPQPQRGRTPPPAPSPPPPSPLLAPAAAAPHARRAPARHGTRSGATPTAAAADSRRAPAADNHGGRGGGRYPRVWHQPPRVPAGSDRLSPHGGRGAAAPAGAPPHRRAPLPRPSAPEPPTTPSTAANTAAPHPAVGGGPTARRHPECRAPTPPPPPPVVRVSPLPGAAEPSHPPHLPPRSPPPKTHQCTCTTGRARRGS